MDDAALFDAIGEADPATAERIASLLGDDPDDVGERLAELESAGRVTHGEGGWRLARDPRLDSSVERMVDRLGRERR
ncbi:hypothetical protein HAPAU_03890 [Halalkalicoccus paucihalophilus]|uniref:HTH arsR-type domain-containing protein n=2 Tax=Halalkalicoccus paucihalophilus TaxID=1008153 RepID=A0A151AJB2_9EURY|nr:hypothetical protein [Halalkalicoccus paucihalophilus]KYH27721.1 hypothetical protein HAPAU_03890 [Halalkalicoccus paucihalophilus]